VKTTVEQPLLQPFTLGDLPLRNRVVMAPLTRTRTIDLSSSHIACLKVKSNLADSL
jgi:2,4-dienoyl-CoA reductase-like NADH-dependent reductase (Old Yellow Enzyme family)